MNYPIQTKQTKESVQTRNMINKIKEVLKQYNATPRTVRYVFKKVREEGNYQVPKVARKLPDYLNDAEIHHILTLSVQKDNTTSLLIHLATFTGLRIKEINDLQIQHIDFYGGQLKVVAGKGNKDRYVPLSTALMQHIKAYAGNRDKGFLFVKSDQTKYTKRALQKKIETMFKECSFVKKLSTHSLRHTYATLLRRRGMSLENIQILLGHGSKKTTEIYAHIELAPVKEEFIRLMGMQSMQIQQVKQ